MESHKAKIERWQAEVDEINGKQFINQDDADRRNQLLNQISEAEYELKQRESDTQERVQKFEQEIDALQLQIQDMDLFGALCPREPFAKLIGLEEYGEKQKDCNQTLYAWATMIKRNTFDQHSAEVEQYQQQLREAKEQIRAGEEREIQFQRQNHNLQDELSKQKIVLEATENRADEAEDRAEQYRKEAEKAKDEVASLLRKVEELQAEVNTSSKPQAPIQTDQSFTDQIAAIRNKNTVKSLKDLSADDLERRFQERQANGGKFTFELPDLSGGSSFRHDSESQSGGVHIGSTTQIGAAVQPVVFPEDSSTTIDGLAGHTTESQDVGSTVESRLAALEIAVFGSAKVAA